MCVNPDDSHVGLVRKTDKLVNLGPGDTEFGLRPGCLHMFVMSPAHRLDRCE